MTTPLARMQYSGWVTFTKNGGSAIKVPITRTNVDAKPNMIICDDLIAGGVPADPASNAVSTTNFAEGKMSFGGDIAFPLFEDWADDIMDMSITNRDKFHSVTIFDGFNKYVYPYFKVKTLTLGGQAQGNGRLDCTMSIEALTRSWTAGADSDVGLNQSAITDTANKNKRPIPFWRTQFTVNSTGPVTWPTTSNTVPSRMVTAWSITIDNQLYIHNAASGSRLPDDIQCGKQKVTGNFTYYPSTTWGSAGAPTVPTDVSDFNQKGGSGDTAGELAPDGTTYYNMGVPKQAQAAGVKFSDTLATPVLQIPILVWIGYPRELNNPNQKPMRAMSFEGLGNLSHGACYVA